MKRKNDQSWKPLAHILSACGIPWIWYLADFIFSLLISMVTVRLPQMTGAIMQGEIFDKGLLADGFIIALEHDSKLPPMIEHDKLEIYDVRHYGELTAISFIRERQ